MSTPKFIPIAFSTEMVQAITENRKTQTRRVIKTQPDNDAYFEVKKVSEGVLFDYNQGIGGSKVVPCPYGKVGDVLWVREEHLITMTEDRKWITVQFKDLEVVRYYYKDLSLNLLKKLYKRKTIGKWQRARFLPKEFARIFLEVTNRRVERLNDISREDAIAEGIGVDFECPEFITYKGYIGPSIDGGFTNPILSFLNLWESINGKESLEANPWLWVIEFKRVVRPTNFLS